ncbi:UNVERIFIED_CONTAM: Pseudouridine-5'-phosphatase [Siphonaria sp. JEL0065]|nr:Pseudouridine-5'-phosphatase [Siphonaria sp. JEL0065]
MDGLLLEDPYTEANNRLLAPFGKVYTWDIKQRIMGRKETDAAIYFLDYYKIPMTPQEYIKERKCILEGLYSDCKPLPGVVRLVTHLKENGIPICIATSSTRAAYILKSSKNKHLFDLFGDNVICSDDCNIANGKPHPDLFLAAARSFGLNVSVETNNLNCLVFEDSPLGVEAGIRANMRVVWIPDACLTIDDELRGKVAKFLASMEDFDPPEFGLPPYQI